MDPNNKHKPPRKSRRKYDETFKAEVLAMVAAGQPASQVAHRLGIGESLIYKWRKRADHLCNGSGHRAPTGEVTKENVALRQELQRTITERDILKKGGGPRL